MAFTNPYAVQRGALATTALAGVVMHETMMGLIGAIRAGREARQEAHAFAAWESALGEARGNAAAMGKLAKVAVEAALDAQDEAEALRAEVVRLRRAVAQRESVIRAMA